MENNKTDITSFTSVFYYIGLLGFGGIMLVVLFFFGSFKMVWDDGYMFVRYADNIIHHGIVAWNPHGPPCYGLTSLLYMFSMVPIRLLTPTEPTLTALFTSLLWGIVFLVAAVFLIRRFVDTGRPQGKAFFLFLLFCLGYNSDNLGYHFMSGMDTMFALFYISVYLLAITSYSRVRSIKAALLTGVLGGLAWWARPDLCLYTYILPGCLLLFGRTGESRKSDSVLLAATVAMTGFLMLVSYLYFDSAAPLPFYAKSTKIYGDFIFKVYRWTPLKHLTLYFSSYMPLFVVIGLSVVLDFRHWLKKESALQVGLLIATAAFIGYYSLFVLQIMSGHERFYYPTLPAILYLSASVGARWIGAARDGQDDSWGGFPEAVWPVVILVLIGILFLLGEKTTREMKMTRKAYRFDKVGLVESFKTVHLSEEMQKEIWLKAQYRVYDFTRLPDDLVIASTEVGLLGAIARDKVLVDMAGLHETRFAKYGFDPDRLFDYYRPDLIYMPHPDYKRIIELIKNDPRFEKNYEYFRFNRTLGKRGVALLKDSPHHGAMMEIMNELPGYFFEEPIPSAHRGPDPGQ